MKHTHAFGLTKALVVAKNKARLLPTLSVVSTEHLGMVYENVEIGTRFVACVG